MKSTAGYKAEQAGEDAKAAEKAALNKGTPFLGRIADWFGQLVSSNPSAAGAAILGGKAAAGAAAGVGLGALLLSYFKKDAGKAPVAPAANLLGDKTFGTIAKDVADQAAKFAGGSGAATAAGGAAGAELGASGARVAATGLRGMLGQLGWAGAALGLGMDLFYTSPEEIAVLKEAERQKNGYRGQGFVDPRRLDLPPASLAVSAPNMPTAAAAPGSVTEVKVGEGKLEITLHLDDQRTWMTPNVVQQPSLLHIEAGSTNPGGFKR